MFEFFKKIISYLKLKFNFSYVLVLNIYQSCVNILKGFSTIFTKKMFFRLFRYLILFTILILLLFLIFLYLDSVYNIKTIIYNSVNQIENYFLILKEKGKSELKVDSVFRNLLTFLYYVCTVIFNKPHLFFSSILEYINYFYIKFINLILNFTVIYLNFFVFYLYIIYKLIYLFLFLLIGDFNFLSFVSFFLFKIEIFSLILIYFLLIIDNLIFVFDEFFFTHIIEDNYLLNFFNFYKIYILNNFQNKNILYISHMFFFEEKNKDFYFFLFSLLVNNLFKLQILIFYYIFSIFSFIFILIKIITKYLIYKLNILLLVSSLNILFFDFSNFYFLKKINFFSDLDLYIYLNHFFNLLFLLFLKYYSIIMCNYTIMDLVINFVSVFNVDSLDFSYIKLYLKILLFDYFYNFLGEILLLFYNILFLCFNFLNLFFKNLNIYLFIFDIFKFNLDIFMLLFKNLINEIIKLKNLYFNDFFLEFMFDFSGVFDDILLYIYIFFIKCFYVFYGSELDFFEYYMFLNGKVKISDMKDYYDYGYIYFYYFDFFWKKIFLYDYFYLSDLNEFFDFTESMVTSEEELFIEQLDDVSDMYFGGTRFEFYDSKISINSDSEFVDLNNIYIENECILPGLSYFKVLPHEEVIELLLTHRFDMSSHFIETGDFVSFINETYFFIKELNQFDDVFANPALFYIFSDALVVDDYEQNADFNDYYFNIFLQEGLRYENSVWSYNNDIDNDIDNAINNVPSNRKLSLKFSPSSIYRLDKPYLYLHLLREQFFFNLNHFRLLIYIYMKLFYFLIFIVFFFYSGFFMIIIEFFGYSLYFIIYLIYRLKLFFILKKIYKLIFYPIISVYYFFQNYFFSFNFNYFFWNFDKKLLDNYKNFILYSNSVKKLSNNDDNIILFNLPFFKFINFFDFKLKILLNSNILSFRKIFYGKLFFFYCNFILIYSWFVKSFSNVLDRDIEKMEFFKYDLDFVFKRGYIDNVDYVFRLENWLNFKIKDDDDSYDMIYFLNFSDYPTVFLHSILFERIFEQYIFVSNFKLKSKIKNSHRFVILDNVFNLFFKSFPNLKVIYFQYYFFLKILIYEYSNNFYKFILSISFQKWNSNMWLFDYVNVYRFKLSHNLLFNLSYIDSRLFNDFSKKNFLIIQLLNVSELNLFTSSYSFLDKFYYFIENFGFNLYLFFFSFFNLLRIFFNLLFYIEIFFKFIKFCTVYFYIFSFFRFKYSGIVSFDIIDFYIFLIFDFIVDYYNYFKFFFKNYYIFLQYFKKDIFLINLIFLYFNFLSKFDNFLFYNNYLLSLYFYIFYKLDVLYNNIYNFIINKYNYIFSTFIYYKIIIFQNLFHNLIFILINLILKLNFFKFNKLIFLNILILTVLIGIKLIFITVNFSFLFSTQTYAFTKSFDENFLNQNDVKNDDKNLNNKDDVKIVVGLDSGVILDIDSDELKENEYRNKKIEQNFFIFITNLIYFNFFCFFNLLLKWLDFSFNLILVYFKNLFIYLFSLFFFIKFLNFLLIFLVKIYVLFFYTYLHMYYYIYKLNIFTKLRIISYFIKIFSLYIFFEEINFFLFILNFISLLFLNIFTKFNSNLHVNKFYYLLHILFQFEFIFIKNIFLNFKKIFLIRFKNKNIINDFHNYEFDFLKKNFDLNNDFSDLNSLVFWKKIYKLELDSDINSNIFYITNYKFIYDNDPLIFFNDFSEDKFMVKYLLINCSQKFYLFLSLDIYSFESLYLFNNLGQMDYIKYKSFGSLVKLRFKSVNFSFDRYDFGIQFLNHYSFFNSNDNRFYNNDYDYNFYNNNFFYKRIFLYSNFDFKNEFFSNKFDYFLNLDLSNEKLLKIKLLTINKSFIIYNINRSFLLKYNKLIFLNQYGNNVYKLRYNVGLRPILKIFFFKIVIQFIFNYLFLFFIFLLIFYYFDLVIIFFKNLYILYFLSNLDIHHFDFWVQSLILFGDYFYDIIFLIFYYLNLLLWCIFSSSFRKMLYDHESAYFDKYDESEQLKKNIPWIENTEFSEGCDDDLGIFGFERDEDDLFSFELNFFFKTSIFEQYLNFTAQPHLVYEDEFVDLDPINILDGDLSELWPEIDLDLVPIGEEEELSEFSSDEYSSFSARVWFLIIFPFVLWSFIFLDDHVTGDSLFYKNIYFSIYGYDLKVGPEALPEISNGKFDEDGWFDLPDNSEWVATSRSYNIPGSFSNEKKN